MTVNYLKCSLALLFSVTRLVLRPTLVKLAGCRGGKPAVTPRKQARWSGDVAFSQTATGRLATGPVPSSSGTSMRASRRKLDDFGPGIGVTL